MRSVAIPERTGLTYRQVDRIARHLWPTLAAGSGSRRDFDARQLAVLGFVGRLATSGLYPDGVPLALIADLDAAVSTGDESTVEVAAAGATLRIVR